MFGSDINKEADIAHSHCNLTAVTTHVIDLHYNRTFVICVFSPYFRFDEYSLVFSHPVYIWVRAQLDFLVQLKRMHCHKSCVICNFEKLFLCEISTILVGSVL